MIHTRNLSTLEAQIPAALIAGARRVHGEHGRSPKHTLLRRAIRPLVQRYIPVNRDLAGWLQGTVRVPPQRIRRIYNSVDPSGFRLREDVRPQLTPPGFPPDAALVIGSVGRLAGVKDPCTLVRAFVRPLTEWGMSCLSRSIQCGAGHVRTSRNF